MRIEIKEPLNEKNKVVNITTGDRVLISEWDGITAIGNVSQITNTDIILENGRFLGDAYSKKVADYSKYKDMTEFTFRRSYICEIKVVASSNENKKRKWFKCQIKALSF